MGLRLVGCYPLDEQPWHLVEIEARSLDTPLTISEMFLEDPRLDRSSWQVPYDEKLLSADGTAELPYDWVAKDEESVLRGNFRLCFFLYINVDTPLRTPLGPLALEPRTRRPSRLDFVQFEEP
jgi:hypothetical protein